MTTTNRVERILFKLKEIISELSGLEPEEIDSDTPFLEMGLDSLFLTQASLVLKREFELKITFRQLFSDAPCLTALAQYVDQQLPDDAVVEIPESAAPVEPSVPEAAPSVAPTPPSPAAPLPQQPPAPAPLFPPMPQQPPAMAPLFPPMPWAAPGAGFNPLQLAVAQHLSAASTLLATLQGFPLAAMPAPAMQQPTSAPQPQAPTEQPVAPVPQAEREKPASSSEESPDASQKKEALKRFGPYKPIEKGPDGGLTPHQQKHLNQLCDWVLKKTPKSKALTAEHRDHFADPRAVGGFKTLWKEIVYPVAVDHSKGSHMWDIDGNEYIDCVGGFGAVFFGHAPDFVVKAVKEQLDKNLDYGPTSTVAGRLAKRICDFTGMDRATFCSNGSEAVLATMRMARTVTGREKIVTFTRDYHGLFDEVLVRAQQIENKRRNVPVAPGIPQDASSNMIVLEYGDPAALKVIKERAKEIAGVLVEPVQSRAPDFQPREFIKELRKITKDLDIPLIFDEIITGFRSHPKGAQGFYDVEADLAAYGNVIGGGMPIGVAAGKSVYMDALDGGTWQYGDDSFPEAGVTYFEGTFVPHPLALASMDAIFDHMEEEGPALQERVNHQCAAFSAELNDFFEKERIPIRMLHFSSVILPKYGGDPDYEGLFYQHLRVRGIHIWEGRPGFMTTAHADEDFAELAEGFKAAALAMIDGGFLHRAEAVEQSFQSIPMTESQLELWLTTQVSDEASRSLNEPGAFSMKGKLNLRVFQRALRQVIQRHDALRATVSPDGQNFRVAPEVEDLEFEVIDLSDLSPEEKEERRDRIYRDDSRALFDLSKAPLIRVTLIRLAEEHHELLLTVHHLICDGWSTNILAYDLSRFYTHGCEGSALDLEDSMPLQEYQSYEKEHRKSEEWRETKEFWENQYATVPPPVDLPLDRPRPPLRTYEGNRQHIVIDRSIGSKIKSYATEHQCTLFSVLLAAFEVLLNRLSHGTDLVVGIPSAGQALLGANNLIAHCVNYLPFRCQVDPKQNFESFVRKVKEEMLRVAEHQDFTFGTLLRTIKVERDPSRPTLVSVDFNVDPAMSDFKFHGLEVEYISTPREFARLELQFNLIDNDGELLLECDHATDIIDVPTARRWMENYQSLLDAIIENPQKSIGELPLLSSEESHAYEEWNRTKRDYDLTHCLHHLIEAQVDKSPESPALTFGDQTISYRELDQRSNHLANVLVEKGAKQDCLIGVCMNRSIDLVVALIGVLKSGGAYVPLDPSYPKERIAFIMKDANASLMITESSVQPLLEECGINAVLIDASAPENSRSSTTRSETPRSSENLAYVIYTSGSTGEPKGVEISHRAAVNFLTSMAHEPGLTEQDVLLASTTISFDIALLELFLPLTVGARTVILDGEASADGARMADAISHYGATVMQATPTAWRILLDAGWKGSPHLRVLCGGEALPRDLANELIERASCLWNMYGPTETTVWSSCHPLSEKTGPVLIGRPIANTQMYVLDEQQQPVPVGVPGELYIGGEGLARGYHNRPDLTKERFVSSPFSDDPSSRLYRTGDLARWLPDGNIQCLDRLDNQVKVRGFRIELGEIDAVFSTHPALDQCVVVVREDRPGDKRLVAYFVPKLNFDPTATELRRHLRTKLPEYMIPQHFVEVDSLPLTPNGKVDRNALPGVLSVDRPEEEYVPPRTEVETFLAETWQDVLGVERVGVNDNFFNLGGHSLLSMNVVSKVEQRTGQRINLREMVFQNLGQLAALVEKDWNGTPSEAVAKEAHLEPAHQSTGEIQPGFGGRLVRAIKSKVKDLS